MTDPVEGHYVDADGDADHGPVDASDTGDYTEVELPDGERAGTTSETGTYTGTPVADGGGSYTDVEQ